MWGVTPSLTLLSWCPKKPSLPSNPPTSPWTPALKYSGQKLEPRLGNLIQEKHVPAREKKHIESPIKAPANCWGSGLAALSGGGVICMWGAVQPPPPPIPKFSWLLSLPLTVRGGEGNDSNSNQTPSILTKGFGAFRPTRFGEGVLALVCWKGSFSSLLPTATLWGTWPAICCTDLW